MLRLGSLLQISNYVGGRVTPELLEIVERWSRIILFYIISACSGIFLVQGFIGLYEIVMIYYICLLWDFSECKDLSVYRK